MNKKTNGSGNGNGSTLKTWAVKLPSELHGRIAEKCRASGIGMQQLGEQVAEQFLADQIQLKKQVYLPEELAVALAKLSDPKVYAAVLKAARGGP